MEIRPFKAYRFNSDVVGNAGDCVSPPYDVISPEMQEQLYCRNEHNIVRIILGKEQSGDDEKNNKYTRAAEFFHKWISENALKQDQNESIYAYVQDFELGEKTIRRYSFIARAKMEEFGKVVMPHERILKKAIVDRLNLQRATGATFGLVFMLYDDKELVADKIIDTLCEGETFLDVTDEADVRHRIYGISKSEDVAAIVSMMKNKSVIIADGHHRYTTGLTYMKESNNPEARYQMMAFSNVCQEGLLVLATHRLVQNVKYFNAAKLVSDLKKNFEVVSFEFSSADEKANCRQKMLARMRQEYDNDRNAFGVYAGDSCFHIAISNDDKAMDPLAPEMSNAWKSLDVSVLHKLIMEQLLGIDEEKLASGGYLQYVKDVPTAIDESIEQVDKGHKQAAFLMNPPKIRQIQEVAGNGERMPQKSTYFYPKVFTGLTINKF